MQTVMRELEWLHILSPIRYEAKKKKKKGYSRQRVFYTDKRFNLSRIQLYT